MNALLAQAVEVIRSGAATSDAEGNYLPGSTTTTIVRARVERRTTSEEIDGRVVQRTGLLAFLPAGTVIGPDDRVRFATLLYEVDGEPERVFGAAAEHHVEVTLRRVE